MLETQDLYLSAIEQYGAEAQIRQAQEEAGELVAVINQWFRSRASNEAVIDEIADTLIMGAQLRLIFGPERVDEAVRGKQERLAERLGIGGEWSLEHGGVIEAVRVGVTHV